ncbi:hypothetical protein FOZ60_005591 [Perkinsus olseni]|uniref:Sorl1p n=2 Tax=Perkinsus olseni TaxID=32597 RepID=A0A7J6NRI4_PEROL|nr:hypothetical protein FOZ60_005591 [Perkinsus olseni]
MSWQVSFYTLICLLVAFTNAKSAGSSSEVAAESSAWCQTHAALDTYSDSSLGDGFLPPEGITLLDYAFDFQNNWYVSGTDLATKKDMVWTMDHPGNNRRMVLEGTATSIDAYEDTYSGSRFVLAIVNNEIRKYGVPGNIDPPELTVYATIQPKSNNYQWSDLVVDHDSTHVYASDLKTNQVYRFDLVRPGYERTSVAGNADGKAIDDATHLDGPQGVSFYNNELYILQGSGDDARVVRWPVGQSSRRLIYEDFIPQGRLGFEISKFTDDYIYYREGDGSVYKRCIQETCSKPTLLAGGCGAGHASNQITNGGSGALRMAQSGNLITWDFSGDRFVKWEDVSLDCTHCPTTTGSPFTSSTTTPASSSSMPPSVWCRDNEAIEINDFLPPQGIDLYDYAFDVSDNWYIAGKDLGSDTDMVWSMDWAGDDREILFEATATAIDAFDDPSSHSRYVLAIVNNEIRLYGAPGNTKSPLEGEFKTIQEPSGDYQWADLVIDHDTSDFYASDLKTNQVYRFNLDASGYQRTSVAGNSDGQAVNDETHLDGPQGVKYYNNELYILQGSGDDARVVRWPVGDSKRRWAYEDFLPRGRFGFEVSSVTEGYIYYREGDGSVYKHCLEELCNEPLLIAGGCGEG